jgi:monofunctional biosynthetic peptidoglycan transglycosylase
MKPVLRWIGLALLAFIGLQVFFIGRIAMMAVVAPESTTFQRSEAWRIANERDKLRWRQQWVPYGQISDNLKRAVIAAEDGSFVDHDGVDWDALEKAWSRNEKAEERAARRAMLAPARAKPPKIVGGSTISQQLAKNLLLSGERTLLRKGQELVLTLVLEQALSKQRILEIYLNSVEWGEGVFGAEAAAQHYFRKPASLAVMLPQPKRFEKNPGSGYIASRTSTIVARMRSADVP